MNFFEIVKENLQNFLRENTKITAGITILLVVLAVFAFVSGIFQEKKKQEIFVFPEQIPFSAVEDFFPPKDDSLTEDYYFSREQNSTWSKDEFDRWFSVPSKENVEALGKSNEKIANEILGAAP
ncbi:MAG: hypothetical protein UDP17_03725 [Treponema sp.]|uniref:hypothetical protein n=1 Tax=uncultured Treponema sp. TaxID=162155 RepID=UPI0025D16F88|nr:hypothetical protein [uncultured Treponema sp.]MEE0352436.1 hypothetical protein [Treponema sp.]